MNYEERIATLTSKPKAKQELVEQLQREALMRDQRRERDLRRRLDRANAQITELQERLRNHETAHLSRQENPENSPDSLYVTANESTPVKNFRNGPVPLSPRNDRFQGNSDAKYHSDVMELYSRRSDDRLLDKVMEDLRASDSYQQLKQWRANTRGPLRAIRISIIHWILSPKNIKNFHHVSVLHSDEVWWKMVSDLSRSHRMSEELAKRVVGAAKKAASGNNRSTSSTFRLFLIELIAAYTRSREHFAALGETV